MSAVSLPATAFMLADLARSGLTPADFMIPPQPVSLFGVEGYRIWYTTEYYKDRLNRSENKYIGPSGVQAPVVMLGDFKGAELTASVEGYKKALAFHIATGIPTFVIDSCHGFSIDKALSKVITSNLEPLSKHLVLFDGDWKTNSNVSSALATYITLLADITVDGVALDLGIDAAGNKLGFDDWVMNEYGGRASWPLATELISTLDMLPKATVSPLDMLMSHTTGSLSLFSEAYMDNTDAGLASLLVKLAGKSNIKYLIDIGKWIVWHDDGSGWIEQFGKPLQLLNLPALHLKKRIETLYNFLNKYSKIDADELTDEQALKIKQLKKQISDAEKSLDKCRSTSVGNNILTNVASRPYIQDRWANFDVDPDLLGVIGGVVDLRTGKLREERREDMISKRCPIKLDVGAQHPRLDSLLSEITSNSHGSPNPERLRILQTRLGACLFGGNLLTSMEIWLGEGANGKSVLSQLIMAALGPYAVTVPASTIMTMFNKRDAEASTPQLVRTIGSRIVFMAESKDTDYIDETTIKLITGGDKYTPRGNYKDGGEYDITFNPVLLTNNLPNVANGDKAFWDRVAITDFPCRWRREGNLNESEQLPLADTWYLYEAKKDPIFISALLAWLVKGAVMFVERKALAVKPTLVHDVEKIKQYQDESDAMRHFVEDMHYTFIEDGVTALNALYYDYGEWCRMNGAQAVKSKTFFMRFEKRFLELEKKKVRTAESSAATCYIGLAKAKKF